MRDGEWNQFRMRRAHEILFGGEEELGAFGFRLRNEFRTRIGEGVIGMKFFVDDESAERFDGVLETFRPGDRSEKRDFATAQIVTWHLFGARFGAQDGAIFGE